MKKEVTICFRTSEELRGALEKAAREDRRSLSSAIELILTDYLEKNHEFPHQKERRRFVSQTGVHTRPREGHRSGQVGTRCGHSRYITQRASRFPAERVDAGDLRGGEGVHVRDLVCAAAGAEEHTAGMQAPAGCSRQRQYPCRRQFRRFGLHELSAAPAVPRVNDYHDACRSPPCGGRRAI